MTSAQHPLLPPMPADQEPVLRFLREAIALARAGATSTIGGPFGALVVHEGLVIGRGQNLVTSALDPTAHAEVVAVRAACSTLQQFHLRGATLYTSCEPCPMCLAAAYWARIARIVYACTREDAAAAGFDDALIYAEISLPPEARQLPMTALLREEGAAAFKEWEANPGRRPY